MEIDLYQISCDRCKVMFWITRDHDDRLRASKESFFCPNGHSHSYKGETCEEKLKRTERYLKNAKNSRDTAIRSNSALRGVITKMRNKP